MAYNFGGKPSAIVPDSPAVKRQKTASGYNNSSSNTPYDSDNDDGDDLFAGYVPDTPKHGLETQPTQLLARNGYETQPTQILAKPGYGTQPTQIIDRNAPRSSPTPATPQSTVQVPASSPFTGPSLTPKAVPGKVASLMAPAGTAFRPPAGIVLKSAIAPTKKFVIDVLDSDEDDGPQFLGGDSDSDDGRMAKADIKPTTFAAPRSTETSFGAASGNSRFQDIVKNSGYQPLPKGVARPSSDAMSMGYGGVRKPPQLQIRSERAQPVQDISLDSVDEALRQNISRIKLVLPAASYLAIRDALAKCKNNMNDAVHELAVASAIEISDDELAAEPARQEPQMKRGLDAPTKSIRDKYSSTQAMPYKPSASTPAKPKRKLMKGRRNPFSPTSSPLKPQAPQAPGSPALSIAESYDSDSDVEEEEEEDPELDARLLKYLNTCSIESLVELTSITKEISEAMVAARPFQSLDAARCVENPKLLKSGKKSARAAIGDKIVDTAHNMFSGYEAIDVLVAKCEELGKPLAEEMGTWGFDVFGASKDGELEMTSLEDDAESFRDSGIGSPTSGTTSPKNGEDDIKTAKSSRKKSNINFLKKPDLMAEDCVLKDYQVVGLNWLALMYRRKLSCILADEMGLGKTCQVIAFLAHLVETGNPGPHLVVCPGSTLENWLRECSRFAPQLMVEPYHGLQKERIEMAETILTNRDRINIVVTTYDMAQKKEDNKFMRKLRPDCCIYDEGHYLKNVNSQRYQGLVKIPASFRLLLTGTPLQNNLQELAALLAFILPHVFQERAEDLNYIFKAKAKTGDKDHAALLSAQRIARARSMLTPFVLRRKKSQVLKHLPSKTCRVEYATLHPTQKKIYDGHLDQARERARLRVEGAKIPKNANDENNPLMQLRKAAIHPMLFRRHFTNEKIEKMADILRKKLPDHFPTDKNHKREHLVEEMRSGSDFWLHSWCWDYPCISSFDVPNLEWMKSGKVDAMMNLVKAYKENGDRVLIFSQFALVLDILEAVLNTSLVAFTRIDGSTKIDERQTLIDNFRDDESITVFLLTTKAGGTGINLMYANKVIIFDSSFNPQDDRQAENRAHRVGQTRDVEVVRLVTKGTVEEQIYALGQSKLVLDGRVAGDDEAAMDAAGEKAVSKMLLEGTTVTDEEDSNDGVEKEVDAKENKKVPTLEKKKSSILSMLTDKKVAKDEKE